MEVKSTVMREPEWFEISAVGMICNQRMCDTLMCSPDLKKGICLARDIYEQDERHFFLLAGIADVGHFAGMARGPEAYDALNSHMMNNGERIMRLVLNLEECYKRRAQRREGKNLPEPESEPDVDLPEPEYTDARVARQGQGPRARV